jgi:DNA-binding TFAR19-related protein (PDSD5 family)
MDSEDLIPRLVLVGSLLAAAIVYTRRRQGRLKKVQQSAASLPGDAAASAASAAATITERSQNMLESLLDSVAEQTIKELKVVLKDGLKRLEKMVDAL